MSPHSTNPPLVCLSVVLLCFGLSGCASSPGDTVRCPDCDNVTELVVGDKCVPIEQVAPCGPDGHVHDDGCHCFSAQSPTPIAGTDYCLQLDCHADEDDAEAHEHEDEHPDE